MKLVVFGLSISSSWGNGHATLWRGLCSGLAGLGHLVVFFERDVPYYADTRDGVEFAGCDLRLYSDWQSIRLRAESELKDADVAMVTSYCPDGAGASQIVLESKAAVRAFYDLDTPVTFAKLDAGQPVEYLPKGGLAGFDIVLSYTGGVALRRLQQDLGAIRVAPLYGSVDPGFHRPAARAAEFTSDLSYLGTYAEDRQEALTKLFLEPARLRPARRFVIGGAQYPREFPWTPNIFFVRHLPPAQHPTFYCSSRLTLNVTRSAMAAMGYCPSGRLFEAAACGVPIVSDEWPGIETFYTPSAEILLCRDSAGVLSALDLSDVELARIARAARDRTLTEHTAEHRARQLESILQEVACGVQA